MYRVLIDGEWLDVKDCEFDGSVMWYELFDGRAGITAYWRLV